MPRKAREVPDGYRWCGYHKAIEPIEEFTGTEHSCREGKYLYHIKRTYGLYEDDFEQLFAQFVGVCHCCKERAAKYVDHDHSTGKVRGLLCYICNIAIGYRENNLNLFEQVDDYIARNE